MHTEPTVAVVTGAGRGIGAGIAAALAARGHHVLVTDIDVDAAEATAASLPAATAMAHDVRDPEAHRRVARAASELGDVAVWVNNAGILSTASVWDATDEQIVSTLEVNTLGVVHGCRAAVDVMRRGSILNVVSLSAHGPMPGLAIYGASKAAALAWTQSLDVELSAARRPIRVRALCPDVVDTALLARVADLPSSALLFTAPILGVDDVGDAAMDLLGSRRTTRTVPGWRAAVVRTSGFIPSVSRTVTPIVARMGERRRRSR